MSEITPAQILEALNDKADRDLGNVEQYLVKDNLIPAILPDYSRIQTVTVFNGVYIIQGNTLSYTCPSHGYFNFYAVNDTGGYTLTYYVNGVALGSCPAHVKNYENQMILCSKGDVITMTQDTTSQLWRIGRCYFIPCKGAI